MAFKKTYHTNLKTIAWSIFMESLHSLGLCCLVFLVLPSLDNSFQVLALLLGVAFLPSCLKIFLRSNKETTPYSTIFLDVVSSLTQLSALIVWPVLIGTGHLKARHGSLLAWSIPLSLLLVSLRWTENYADHLNKVPMSVKKYLKTFIFSNNEAKTEIQLIANIWKICLTTVLMPAFASLQVGDMDPFFDSAEFKKLFTSVFDFDPR